MNDLIKSTKQFRLSLKVFVGIVVVLPILHSILFKFNLSSFSVAFSMVFAVWLFNRNTLNDNTFVKFNAFVWSVYLTPVIAAIIAACGFYFEPVKIILDVFPIYVMLPMLIYFYMITKYLYKILESQCNKLSVINSLKMQDSDYKLILNFSDKKFVEHFRHLEVDVGSHYIKDSKVHVQNIMNPIIIKKVCQLTEKKPNELTTNDFTLYHMIEI